MTLAQTHHGLQDSWAIGGLVQLQYFILGRVQSSCRARQGSQQEAKKFERWNHFELPLPRNVQKNNSIQLSSNEQSLIGIHQQLEKYFSEIYSLDNSTLMTDALVQAEGPAECYVPFT